MTSWKEERDRLVAQTLAFVREVAAAHPTAKVTVEPTAVDLLPETSSPAPFTAARTSLSIPTRQAKPLADLVSERADIMQRVEAFRARQSRIIREREAYYESVKARIQTELRNDSPAHRL